MSDVLYELRGIEKAFDGVQVLRGVDLDIRREEVITFIGLSGSGKSVLLKMLIGLIPPDKGTITFDGEDVSQLSEAEWVPVRRRVGISFQEPALFDSMLVEDNVKYGLREIGELGEEAMAQRTSESLTAVGLPGIEEMWPSDLSGGMQKRVGIARAVALQPEALIYDEPFEGLDPINVTRVNRLMLGLRDQLNVTTMVATHNLKAAFEVSDRIAFLHEGQIARIGSPDELTKDHPDAMKDFIEKATFETPEL